MSNYRLLVALFILPGALWALGSFTLQKVDRLQVNTESKISVLSPMDVQDRFTVTTTSEASIPCPPMTAIQRDALTPVDGDCVFNDDDKELNIYDGTSWVAAGGGGSTLQEVYDASTTGVIGLDGTIGGFKIEDNSTSIGSDLFAVGNNTLSTIFFRITATIADFFNLRISGNTISSTDTNGNINLTPNGTGVVNSTNLNLSSSTTVSSILDEDTMSSDSATALATQQSIKAYVDANSAALGGVCVLTDQKSSATNGGSATASSWNARVLNTAAGDCSFVTLSNGTTGTDGTANYWTLAAGTYYLSCTAPAYLAVGSQLRIMQDPGGTPTTVANGNSRYGPASSSDVINEIEVSNVTIASPMTYQLQHWISSTTGAGTASLGVDSGSGVTRYFGRCVIIKY